MRPFEPIPRAPRRALAIVALAALALASSCRGARVTQVPRQNLFSISIGKMENQLDLLDGDPANPSKLRLYMRNGIFFVSNGQGKKVMEFSSYGDVLSLFYNPDSNPAPVLLSPPDSQSGFRKAYSHPFRDIGEIVVDSQQNIYLEDHLPPERRVQADDGSIMDAVVLRFGPDGSYRDYLGQEGLGGTPFPNIVSLAAGPGDDVVVVSATEADWRVSWFSSEGTLRSSLVIGRDSLPVPAGKKLIASLEKIAPDPDSRLLYLKIDYYRQDEQSGAGSSGGAEYDSTILWSIDPQSGKVSGSFSVPSVTKKAEGAFSNETYVRLWSFIGAASGRNLFFGMPEDDGSYTVMIQNALSGSIRKFSLAFGSDEEVASAFHLDRTGIISALLVGSSQARVVWWRIDRIIGDAGR